MRLRNADFEKHRAHSEQFFGVRVPRSSAAAPRTGAQKRQQAAGRAAGRTASRQDEQRDGRPAGRDAAGRDEPGEKAGQHRGMERPTPGKAVPGATVPNTPPRRRVAMPLQQRPGPWKVRGEAMEGWSAGRRRTGATNGGPVQQRVGGGPARRKRQASGAAPPVSKGGGGRHDEGPVPRNNCLKRAATLVAAVLEWPRRPAPPGGRTEGEPDTGRIREQTRHRPHRGRTWHRPRQRANLAPKNQVRGSEGP